MPMVYNPDTGEYEFVSDGVYSGPASQGNSIQGNFGDDYIQQLAAMGYIPEMGITADNERLSGAGGNKFNSDLEYLTYLYGPGVTKTDYNGETFYKTPNGLGAYQPGASPLSIASDDPNFSIIPKLALGSIIGLGALNGAFGSLGGLGEMGAADAAWGVNPATTGTAESLTLGGGNLGSQFGTAALGLGDAATWGGGLGSEFGTAALGLGGAGGFSPALGDASWGANILNSLQQGGSAVSNLLGSNPNLTSILGSLGAAGLGAYGANQQADAYGNLASQYMGMGQPYRDKLLQSYQPGFDLASADPAFQGALDQAGQSAARATSAKVGNPVDNPGAYAEMQKYITNSVALPQLNTYRSQLGSFGQLGTNQAGTAQMGQIQSQGGMYDALGFGLGQVTQPENPLKGLLDQFSKQTINNWRSY